MEKTYDATIDYTPADVRWPYRRLEYIRSSDAIYPGLIGDQYVIIGEHPKAAKVIVGDMSEDLAICGSCYERIHAGEQDQWTLYNQLEYGDSKITWKCGDGVHITGNPWPSVYTASISADLSEKHTIKVNYDNDGKFWVDESYLGISNNRPFTPPDNKGTWYLFALHDRYEDLDSGVTTDRAVRNGIFSLYQCRLQF